MTRKSPIRHKVRSHTRGGKRIVSFLRGSGKQNLQTKRRTKIHKVKSLPVRTTRDFVKLVATSHGGLSNTSFDSDEDIFASKEEIIKIGRTLESYGFKVIPNVKGGPITLDDVREIKFEADILGVATLHGKQKAVPTSVLIKDWRTFHIHAPSRKVKDWHDRGWEQSFEQMKNGVK